MIANFFYGFHLKIFNCTFISNHAQFFGILSSNNFVSSLAILNITSIVSISSSASNQNTYLGVDFSEGGAFGGSGYGGNSYYYFNNCKFMNGYSPRGSIVFLVN